MQARANRIRADADREVTIIKAEATREGERTRGEGDAERNRIFADAFSRDPDFFGFYRSMQAYEQGIKSSDTRMLLSPDSEFFKLLQQPVAANTCERRSAEAMSDFVVAIGLVLVIEGLLWAAAPQLGLKLLEAAAQMPEHALRTAGRGGDRGGVRARLAGARLKQRRLTTLRLSPLRLSDWKRALRRRWP